MNDETTRRRLNRKQTDDTQDNLDQELSFDLERLARNYADDFELDGSDDQAIQPSMDCSVAADQRELSLEELGQAFAKVVSSTASHLSVDVSSDINCGASSANELPVSEPESLRLVHLESSESDGQESSSGNEEDDQFPITPMAIVESVLLVGRPDNRPITSTDIAALMRGVTESEVDKLVAELNADYIANQQAFQIFSVEGGYKLQVANDLESIREALLGPSKPVRLSQAAIDCMALVSYQPGIRRDELDEQLGKSSSSILNQLVRRELLAIRREKIDGERKLVARYYPTKRFLDLAGLESLDDLPTAEEWVERT